jgi:hypothetical protein
MSASPSSLVYRHPPAALLRIAGEDALAFLQGQFTQELRHPTGARAAYGLWLNQKGRVLGDSVALRAGPVWRLFSEGTAAAALKERLEAYIIADDVTVEDETEAWTAVTFVGAALEAAALESGVVFPGDGLHLALDGALLFRSRRAGPRGWTLLLPRGAAEPRWLADRPDAAPVELTRRRLRSGWPAVPSELGHQDLPNEGDLEEIAISYTKGCYLGQEVMARLKSMGQVRRKLRPVGGSVAVPPTLPVPLFANGKRIGELRSAFPVEEGSGFVGMAMLTLLGLDLTQPLALEAEGPPVVRLLATEGTPP